MKKFTLSVLFHIIGIGAASGLIYQDNSLYVIGDNSGYLYKYNISSKQVEKQALISNPMENMQKKEKADFESITHYGDTLYIFGSGSGKQVRNQMVEFETKTKTKTKIKTNNLDDLYALIQNFAEIKPKQFNIEGAIFEGDNWYLFNRGNGKDHRNTIFTIHSKNLSNELAIVATNYKLPKIKGIRSGFSDAILVDNKIYFLATVEDLKSTTADGRILGSFIGRMDLNTMKIDFTKQITKSQKFEGITLYKKEKDRISFLLCEDNDSSIQESDIYKLSLDLKE